MSLAPRLNWICRSLALALLLLAGAAHAQGGRGLEVQVVSPTLTTVAPGSIVTLSLRVRNVTTNEETILERIELPRDWTLLIPPTPVSIPAGESLVRLVAVQVPQSAPTGRFVLRYTAVSRRDENLQGSAAAEVVVRPVEKVTLTLLEKPDLVIAGQPYQITLQVTNAGNAPVTFALQAVSRRPGYTATLTPAALTLAAGEGAQVTLAVTTDAREARQYTHYVEAQALMQGRVVASLTLGAEVVPRAAAARPLRHLLPTTLTLRTTADDRTAGLQVRWQGAGSLHEDGRDHLSFILQGPDAEDTGIYGWRDAYRVRYTREALAVQAGDGAYSLSALTDYSHYGRGIGLDLGDRAGVTGGAYLVQNRWQTDPARTTGAYLRVPFSESMEGKLNVAARRGGEDDADLISAEVFARLGTGRLRAEVGHSDGATGDTAYDLEWRGQLGATRLALRHTHAGPDYLGYYRDSDYTNAAATLPVTTRLSASISYSRWRRNLDLRPERLSAPDERLLQGLLRYEFPSGWHLSAGYDLHRRLDRLDGEASHETPLTLAVGRATPAASWRLETRQGQQTDPATGRRTALDDYRVYLTRHADPRRFITLYGGYRRDDRPSQLLGPGAHAGGAITWTPTDAWAVTANFSQYGFSSAQRNQQFELTARHRLPGEHSLELRALTIAPTTGPHTRAYLLAYTLPLDIPVAPRTGVGQVRGRVTDHTTPARPGVGGVVLLLNGAATISEPDGSFAFPALPPGRYELTVDRKSLGPQRVTTEPLPYAVEITGGKTTWVEIGLSPAAVVQGTVQVIPNGAAPTTATGGATQPPAGPVVIGDPNKPPAQQPYGLREVLVEITNGRETYRRLTDHHGAFLFEGLRPGVWRLRIYPDNLPPYHVLESPTAEFTISPGATVTLQSRVLPRVRRIKMIEP